MLARSRSGSASVSKSHSQSQILAAQRRGSLPSHASLLVDAPAFLPILTALTTWSLGAEKQEQQMVERVPTEDGAVVSYKNVFVFIQILGRLEG